MPWYLRSGDALYRAETTITAPGWSIGPDTPHDQVIEGWTWYDSDDAAMTATGLVSVITARLDKVDPPLSPTQAANRAALTGTATLASRLDRLAAYKTDTEIVAALARANTTAPTTQELNRLLKVMLRRDERQSATIALLVRLIDPALLATLTDTADA